MLEEMEYNFRAKAILTEKQINTKQRLVVRVIYEQLFQLFEREKNITGVYLREPCLKEQDQIYQFSLPGSTTLEDWIQKQTIFSEEEITVLFNQLILALFEVHRQGVLGRCFTIYNIYYDRHKITLSNFGFYSDLQLRPPEQLKYGTYSLGIDMWLLGCILYQLSTNEILSNFNSYDEYNLFYQKIDKKRLPKSLSSLLLKMLNPKECNRLRFGELHSIYKCQYENNHLILFYKSQFNLLALNNQISDREDFNLEWAIVKEFNGKSNIYVIKQTNQIINAITVDPDPNFMLIYNRSDQEKALYPQIWREMHFQYFRFHIMENTIRLMKLMFQMPFIIWTQYALQTMQIIIKKQFLKEINQSINIVSTSINEWHHFLSNSQQFRQHLYEIKNSLKVDILELEKLSPKIQFEKPNFSIFEIQLYRDLERVGFYLNTSEYDKFEQFRIPYRKCLQHCYYELEKMIEDEKGTDDAKFLSRLRLQLIISMIINRIFDENKQSRSNTFNILKFQYKLENINTPNHLVQFLNEAPIEQLQAQTDQIHNLFFRSNSSISTIKKE